MVGAIVVRGRQRIAAGHHTRAGEPHAEALALARAGERARGATLYVTLEPCAHHGRTPPCLDAVLRSGVSRVVIGTEDVDPRSAGRGVAGLREHGIEVVVGVERDRCRELNRGYFSRIERERPYTLLKLAASLDGRLAARSGDSRWITGEPARAFVHRLRARVDAIAVGSATAVADDPELTARRAGRVLHSPVRIAIDSQLRVAPSARFLRSGPPGTAWILTHPAAPQARRSALERAGARLIDVPLRGARLDLAAAWRELARSGCNEVLVEGGGQLAAALLRAGLVDALYVFAAPLLIGEEGRPLLGALGVERLADALRPERSSVRKLGADLLWILVGG
jgi:diaminohydroxyphosphoribosylaminopyrimidine deaminase/5-amino-6-(5-phosphoribosylamino)uracil reductase